MSPHVANGDKVGLRCYKKITLWRQCWTSDFNERMTDSGQGFSTNWWWKISCESFNFFPDIPNNVLIFKIQSNSVITNSMGPAKFVRYNWGSL